METHLRERAPARNGECRDEKFEARRTRARARALCNSRDSVCDFAHGRITTSIFIFHSARRLDIDR